MINPKQVFLPEWEETYKEKTIKNFKEENDFFQLYPLSFCSNVNSFVNELL